MQYWQIGTGDGQVYMVDIFIKLQLALIGPGREGDYFDNKETYRNMGFDGQIIQRFAEEVQIGDIFVLKHIVDSHKKTWRVYAVGEVVGPYRYEPIFDKVDCYEWDVQHCRRVLWKVPKEETIADHGGAPIRLQRLEPNNPLSKIAEQILNGQIEIK